MQDNIGYRLELTDKEFEKYSKMFVKYFKEIGRDELRLVHYSYYNGCDEPSVYEFEEIQEENNYFKTIKQNTYKVGAQWR